MEWISSSFYSELTNYVMKSSIEIDCCAAGAIVKAATEQWSASAAAASAASLRVQVSDLVRLTKCCGGVSAGSIGLVVEPPVKSFFSFNVKVDFDGELAVVDVGSCEVDDRLFMQQHSHETGSDHDSTSIEETGVIVRRGCAKKLRSVYIHGNGATTSDKRRVLQRLRELGAYTSQYALPLALCVSASLSVPHI